MEGQMIAEDIEMMMIGEMGYLLGDIDKEENNFWAHHDDDMYGDEGLGATSVSKQKSLKIPGFSMPTVPNLPKPPVAFSNIQGTFNKLGTYYKDLISKKYTFTYGTKKIVGYGLADFASKGSSALYNWYKRKGCGSLDVGCHYSNLKKLFNGFYHTRAFILHVTKLLGQLLAKGVDLHKRAGESTLKNMAALPKQARDWIVKVQKSYSNAFNKWVKKIQTNMYAVVEDLRSKINKTFKDAEKQFNAFVNKNVKNLKKEATKIQKDLKKRIDNAKKALENDVKKLKAQIDTAKKEVASSMSIVNAEIQKLSSRAEELKKNMAKLEAFMKSADDRLKEVESKVESLWQGRTVPTVSTQQDSGFKFKLPF